MAPIPTERAENQSSKYKNTHYVRDCNHTVHLSVFRLICFCDSVTGFHPVFYSWEGQTGIGHVSLEMFY